MREFFATVHFVLCQFFKLNMRLLLKLRFLCLSTAEGFSRTVLHEYVLHFCDGDLFCRKSADAENQNRLLLSSIFIIQLFIHLWPLFFTY